MNTREKILSAVLQNQPEFSPLPDITKFKVQYDDILKQYIDTFTEISGTVRIADDFGALKALLKADFDFTKRVVTTLPELQDIAELVSKEQTAHSYDNVEVAVIQSGLAVAENGAIWLTEQDMGHRVIPYICQHLAVLVKAEDIVSTLHNAYEKIGLEDSYGFAGFIGGPSKTADIEQALVLGAHGPLTMTVIIMK